MGYVEGILSKGCLLDNVLTLALFLLSFKKDISPIFYITENRNSDNILCPPRIVNSPVRCHFIALHPPEGYVSPLSLLMYLEHISNKGLLIVYCSHLTPPTIYKSLAEYPNYHSVWCLTQCSTQMKHLNVYLYLI